MPTDLQSQLNAWESGMAEVCHDLTCNRESVVRRAPGVVGCWSGADKASTMIALGQQRLLQPCPSLVRYPGSSCWIHVSSATPRLAANASIGVL